MAIAPIPNIYHGFTFAGEYSADYGVYIQEPAVFDAPERDVEMITIPGRDGELVLDKGRYRNIEVTYHCTLPTSSEGDFITGIANFRNMLASKVGYQRLEDDINTSEYRQAAFNSGLSVNTVNIESGTFDVVFNCKPQRFLTTGETAVAMTSGDTITNPTLFESKPQLQVWGYGDIDMGGSMVSIANALVGNTLIGNGGVYNGYTPDYSMANPGDTVTVDGVDADITFTFVSGLTPSGPPTPSTLDTVTWAHGSGTATWSIPYAAHGRISISAVPDPCAYGTASTVFEVTIRGTFKARDSGMNMKTGVYDIKIKGDVNAAGTFKMTKLVTQVSGDTMFYTHWLSGRWGTTYVDSTKSALGTPTYIDLDIGEAYYYSGSDVISANNAVTIPAVLPTLPPGATTITYDNTITQFKVVPRWWQL